jgi:hypothetical protein
MIKGIFISNWDDNIEISTYAELDEQTGEIIAESVDVDVDILNSEVFISETGETFEVCPECHSFILKTVIENEVKLCSNPDCENSEFNNC